MKDFVPGSRFVNFSCTDSKVLIPFKVNGFQATEQYSKLETVSIAEPLQNRQHARLMLSTLERKGKREG